MLKWQDFDRSHKIFVWMTGLFLTCLLIANLVGSLLFSFKLPFAFPSPNIQVAWDELTIFPIVLVNITWVREVLLSAGIIPFPVTFILTDLINEFYGKQGARFVTFVGFGMSILVFMFLSIGDILPVDTRTVMPFSVYHSMTVLYTGMFIASLTAYLIGQLLDIQIFHIFRAITKHRFIWLRATGSTVISQLFDSLIVTFIAFWGDMAVSDLTTLAMSNYAWKFVIAVGITPLLYLGHIVLNALMPNQEKAVETAEPAYQERH